MVVVLVLGDPDGVLRELGALGVVGGGVREEHLAVGGQQLEADRGVGGWVDDALVEEFESAVFGVVEVVAAFVRDGRGGCRVADAEGVMDGWVVEGQRVRLFDEEGVVAPAEGRVDAETEEVLMIWCKNSGGHFRAIWQVLVGIEAGGYCRQDTSGSDFVMN